MKKDYSINAYIHPPKVSASLGILRGFKELFKSVNMRLKQLKV